MKVFHIIMLVLVWTATSFSQCSPEVSAIVEKISEKMSNDQSYSVDFELDLAYVGETSQIQKGQLKIKGSNFHLSLPDQKMICDSKALYIILSDAKEVQILPLGDEGMTNLSPVDLLNQYCGNDFLSAVQGKAKEDGKEVLHLEFTPVDKTEDLFKVRVSYLESQNEIYRIKTFSKDGSRMTLTATNYNFKESLPSELFTFDQSQYQNYNIEDLR